MLSNHRSCNKSTPAICYNTLYNFTRFTFCYILSKDLAPFGGWVSWNNYGKCYLYICRAFENVSHSYLHYMADIQDSHLQHFLEPLDVRGNTGHYARSVKVWNPVNLFKVLHATLRWESIWLSPTQNMQYTVLNILKQLHTFLRDIFFVMF